MMLDLTCSKCENRIHLHISRPEEWCELNHVSRSDELYSLCETCCQQGDIKNVSISTIRVVTQMDNSMLREMIRKVFHEYGAPQVGTVYADPSINNLFNLFQKSNSVLWVVQTEGVVLGCCGIYPTPGLSSETVELVKFYIDNSIRGMGLGKQLFKKSIQSARELGYSKIYIESLPAFDDAVKIYEKQGFQRLDHPLGDSGHSSCNIWMVKNLES